MFLHVCVILFTVGVCLSACCDTQPPPPGKETPLARQIPPLARRPPWQGDPPVRQTPLARKPPVRSACWEIRSTSGRYASYWNAILVNSFIIPSVISCIIPNFYEKRVSNKKEISICYFFSSFLQAYARITQVVGVAGKDRGSGNYRAEDRQV